jgi:D-inositol-3-phosphate glycosyltransferase
MSVRSLAIISLHTSPLAQPGCGDGGGMNVYVRSLASALARAGVSCDVFTRAEHPTQPPAVVVEPGFRVLHVAAGPRAPVDKEALVELVDEFTASTRERMLRCGGEYELLHANYWLSGQVAHVLKHEFSRPMVATFHTLARVKAEATIGDEPERRARAEADIVRCADMMLASTDDEVRQLARLYGADPERVEIVAPGVDHRRFSPGDRAASRDRLGLAGRRVLLFVGRIQPLKGLDLAVRCLAQLDDPDAVLLVVGGPSGADGAAELARVRALVHDLGLERRVRFVAPRPHAELVTYYRAADVCLVPSRSESFGLVALEAAACGTPVVAAAVGGLRSLVDDGVTGFLVDGRDPIDYAAPVANVLDDRDLADAMGVSAAARSMRYSWSMTAARLRRLYGDLVERALVECA